MQLTHEQPAIMARNLTKIYRTAKTRVRALAGVDLDVNKGEFVAVVGTSGSGKSTLLSLMAGLEPPSGGRIMISGHGIHNMGQQQLVKFRLWHMGFIFQQFNLLEALTLGENVALPLMAQGVRPRDRLERAEVLLERMGLADHAHHRPGELSGGQLQRAAIARAIITDPDIVFADEPTGNLDTATADQIMAILKELPITLVMVTHDMGRAQAADRIIRIEDGRIMEEG